MRLRKWVWITLAAVVLMTLVFVVRNNPQLIGMRPYEAPRWEVYKQPKEGDALRLRLYFPKDPEERNKLPVMVFLHGGGWYSGHVGQFYKFAEAFASRGYLAVLVEYRLTESNSQLPFDAVSDVRDAMEYLHRHAATLNIDQDRIAVTGASAGGHLALSTILPGITGDPAKPLDATYYPDAVILLSGIIDTGPEGYGSKEVKAMFKQLSPIHNLRADMPPIRLIFGDQDRHTTVDKAREFVRLAEDLGNTVDLMVFEGGDHGFFEQAQNPDAFAQVLDWEFQFLEAIGIKPDPGFE